MFLSQYIKNQYGSKRGLLRALNFSLKTTLGFYGHYQNIAITKSTRFVFICSGNICRSALADWVARHLGANSISFGLHTRGGDKADERAIQFAQSIGIDMSAHVTQSISDYQPLAGDIFVCMEPAHARELEVLFGNRVPITLAGLWLPRKKAYLHDPYNSNSYFFNLCEQQVRAAVEQLVSKAS